MISILRNIVQEAGKIILDVYEDENFEIEMKADNSPLTVADKQSHEFILSELQNKFPEIPVISEEGKDIPFNVRKTWQTFFLVDPLDGTKEFIKRNGEFTINIGLIKNNKPVVGIIHIPVKGVTYFGEEDKGSWVEKETNGKVSINKIHVSNKSSKDELNVVQSRSHSGEEENEFYSKFRIKERLSKGSSLKICMIAEGTAEIYYRGGPTWEWDTAAGHAILNAAGGYMVNKDKSCIKYNKEVLKHFGFIAAGIKIEGVDLAADY